MKQFDLRKVGASILRGVRELCGVLKVPPPTETISEQSLKYLIVILRERRDIPGFFPDGKDITINALDSLFDSPSVEVASPIDRHKVALAIELLEQSGAGEFSVSKYSAYQEWSYDLDFYEKKALDIVLKRVKRVKREKPYDSSTSVWGKCKIEGLPVSIRNIGECKVAYEEYEEEVDEMIATGKKVKVKKKRAVTQCPDADIVNQKATGRRVVT